MYVSTQLTFKLDEVVKSFEVALRSYLTDKIKPKFSTDNDFKQYLEDLKDTQEASSIIFSSKIEMILKKFINDYSKIYKLLDETSHATIQKDFLDQNVPYVSELINIIIIFFKELDELKSIHNNYTTVEEFIYKCSLYHRIRNDLSHPGSKKILKTEATEILKLVSKFIDELDDKYFWFVAKNDLTQKINDYYKQENNKTLKYDNLKSINVSHQKTICREMEIKKLFSSIIGDSEYTRVAGSTIIYGYGGVGKTALVIDFIYEIIQKIQSGENIINYDFILFFSSKDEVLSMQKTTGEYYIDKLTSNIHTYEDIIKQILKHLELNSFEELQQSNLNGLITIDNIENLKINEKNKIFEMMKKLPRNIQFILTSRNEEPCEEKIHLSEFKDFEKGKEFIINYINTNDLNIQLSEEQVENLLTSTKGNTLLLVQSLLSLNDKTTTVDEISTNLNNYESSAFEKVVSFMYKNTFDNAIKELEDKGYNPKSVILIATLYEEKIDLYALSQLSELNINEVREVSNYLASKLIFNKTQEFYTVNEFASRFIFISLMPNKYEKNKLQDDINTYKNDLKQKLFKMEKQRKKNPKIDTIIKDWRPNNYIDQIVITEVFHMFNKFKDAIRAKNNNELKILFDEYLKYELTTKHPYIRFQKARILNLLIAQRYYDFLKEDEITKEINRCYEDTLESINTSYSYIKNTESHIAVLMLYGFFLNKNIEDFSRAIRFLEDAEELQNNKKDKKYYLVKNELYKLYLNMYRENTDAYYKNECYKVYNEIIQSNVSPDIFDIKKFKKFHENNKEVLENT
jgi:hypothetical protein